VQIYAILNLADLKIGLDDLLTKRHTALTASQVGVGHKDILVFQSKAIDALPSALTTGRPLVEGLSSVDEDHDGFGMALWHMTESYIRVPRIDSSVIEAVHRIRAAFIPERSQLQESYADEAEAAIRRKPSLVALEADLKLIPVALGGTLLNWATSFLAAGENLSVLLSQRADIDGKTRKLAGVLRSETVGILNELRRGIAREQRRKPELPSDLDAQIFSYFDTLEAQREAANRSAKAAAKAAAAKGNTPAEPAAKGNAPAEAPEPEDGEAKSG
jgi:hypothetical protein